MATSDTETPPRPDARSGPGGEPGGGPGGAPGREPGAPSQQQRKPQPPEPRYKVYGKTMPEDADRDPNAPPVALTPEQWAAIKPAEAMFITGEYASVQYSATQSTRALARKYPTLTDLSKRFSIPRPVLAQVAVERNWLGQRSNVEKLVSAELSSLRAETVVLARRFAIETIDRFVGKFSEALDAGDVKVTSIQDFNIMVRLREFLAGNADSRAEVTGTITLDSLQSRHREVARVVEMSTYERKDPAFAPVVAPAALEAGNVGNVGNGSDENIGTTVGAYTRYLQAERMRAMNASAALLGRLGDGAGGGDGVGGAGDGVGGAGDGVGGAGDGAGGGDGAGDGAWGQRGSAQILSAVDRTLSAPNVAVTRASSNGRETVRQQIRAPKIEKRDGLAENQTPDLVGDPAQPAGRDPVLLERQEERLVRAEDLDGPVAERPPLDEISGDLSSEPPI